MPTLAEKLKGISSLPGSRREKCEKRRPSAEGVARLRRGGCKVAFIISHSVYISLILTRSDVRTWFLRVWLDSSCSFVVFVALHFLEYLIGCFATEKQGLSVPFYMFCNQLLAKITCISLVPPGRFFISHCKAMHSS